MRLVGLARVAALRATRAGGTVRACNAPSFGGALRLPGALIWLCTVWLCTVWLCTVWLCTATASADVRLYRGPHPYDLQGHWHAEAGLHEHDTLPVGLDAFADLDGVLVFLGDPVAFGFTGDVWAFAGPHPIPFAEAYCGLRERHQHAFAPEGAFRRETDGSYRFVGALRGGLAMLRPRRTEPPQPVASAPATYLVLPTWGACPTQVIWGPTGPTHVPAAWCGPPWRGAMRPPRPPAADPPPEPPRFPRSRRFGPAHPAAGRPLPPTLAGQ